MDAREAMGRRAALKALGRAAAVLVAGLVLAGCPEGDGGDEDGGGEEDEED